MVHTTSVSAKKISWVLNTLKAEPHAPPPLFASRPEFLSRRFSVNGHKLIEVIDLIVIIEYLDVIEADYAFSHKIISSHHLCCWMSGRNVSVEIVSVEITALRYDSG